MSVQALTEMSNRYGSDPRYVLAGGGNTSLKQEGVLYIKGSGAALATIRADQFVALDRKKLAAVWGKRYPDDFDEREAAALADLMDARLPGETGRPSVETLLHDILPFAFVCHLHPGAVNAMTCAKGGKEAAQRLFPDALWVDAIMPGYVLAAAMKRKLDAAGEKRPNVIFIENHGVFIGGDTVAEIDAHYARVMDELEAGMQALPLGDARDERALSLLPMLRMALWEGNSSFLRFAPLAFESDADLQKGLILTLSPDHMVYCGASALFLTLGQAQDPAKLRAAVDGYLAESGALPRVVAVQGVGLFASGGTVAACDAAYDIMLDSARVCANAKRFGGAKPMPAALIEVIGDWEVERYRKGKVTGGAQSRAAGKIALVTGAAQGFGAGIAQELAAQGAVVALCDLNGEGAALQAAQIERTFGAGSAIALTCDVTREADVRRAVAECVLRYGGLDLMISNAGIVRAGALDALSVEDFRLSTEVNYTAFFLCARQAAQVMRRQSAVRPDILMDIVQVNSKSGLVGSNRNFAYAGAKFGGIGLVQSFALELAGDGIKVNAVCPGNFLDGPLWSDPDNGLFAQYLKAGKVPGAKSVADVRAHYEGLVPMGRGCRVIDVVRAILYIVEQQYETGQAVPVTGGQQMLH